VQYINRTYLRIGTLWDSRYKSSLVQAEIYLLTCQRYIELNPVRAAMEEDIHLIRKAAHYCQPVGSDYFRQQIEQKYGIKLGYMERGRPGKETNALPNF
jgi:thiaminase